MKEFQACNQPKRKALRSLLACNPRTLNRRVRNCFSIDFKQELRVFNCTFVRELACVQSQSSLRGRSLAVRAKRSAKPLRIKE